MSQQPSTSGRKSKSKKKRKKSDATSPRDIQNKKSKSIIDGDIDTDIEYLSAPEPTDSAGLHTHSRQHSITQYYSSHQTSTMDVVVTTSTAAHTPTSTLTSMSTPTLTSASTTGSDIKFSLTNADRNDIAQLVCDKLKNDFAAMILELTQPMRDELSETRKRLDITEQENVKLRADLNDLRSAIDDQEQYSRRSCLRISGIVGDDGSPSENVEHKLLTLAATHKIPIKTEDIDIAHRLGKPSPGYNRPVIVKFGNSKARQSVLEARKSLGSVYVNEDLTKYRQNLHYHARKLVRDKKLDRTWIGGGKVFARFPFSAPGTKVLIRSMADIDNIREGKPLAPPPKAPLSAY
ncbi:MAG: hypothetical protein ABW185_19250 [Sedimenticola sp.]